MKYDTLKNSRDNLPLNPGEYDWLCAYTGTYFKVIWDMQNWHLNGQILDKYTIERWRER